MAKKKEEKVEETPIIVDEPVVEELPEEEVSEKDEPVIINDLRNP